PDRGRHELRAGECRKHLEPPAVGLAVLPAGLEADVVEGVVREARTEVAHGAAKTEEGLEADLLRRREGAPIPVGVAIERIRADAERALERGDGLADVHEDAGDGVTRGLREGVEGRIAWSSRGWKA